MIKPLIGIAMLAVVLPIYGQEKRPETSPNQNHAEDVNQRESPSPKVVSVVDQPASNAQSNSAKHYPQDYFSRLLSPENLPNIGLLIAGIIGIRIAVRTLDAIREQAKLMAGQLGEMEKSREIETKTLLLQYRPKIIVRKATGYDFNIAELGQAANGRVQFTIVNIGGTTAYVTGGTVAMWSCKASAPKTEIKRGEEYAVDQFTLQPGQDRTVDMAIGTGATNDVQWANFHAGIGTEPQRFIYLVCQIN